MYSSGAVYGQPVPSDFLKYEADASFTRELLTFGSGTAASKELGSADARVTFTAVESGTAGNGITIAIVDPAENDYTMTVSVTYGTTPTDQINVIVYPSTNGSGTITSTANNVRDAVNADPVAKLHMVSSIENGAGTSAVVAAAQTALTGGTAGAIHNAGEVVSTNSVTGMTGQYVVGGSNGTGTIVGILYDAVDTTETEKEGVVIVRGPATVYYDNLTLPSNAVKATVQTALLALDIKAI